MASVPFCCPHPQTPPAHSPSLKALGAAMFLGFACPQVASLGTFPHHLVSLQYSLCTGGQSLSFSGSVFGTGVEPSIFCLYCTSVLALSYISSPLIFFTYSFRKFFLRGWLAGLAGKRHLLPGLVTQSSIPGTQIVEGEN